MTFDRRLFVLVLSACLFSPAAGFAQPLKPRVVVLTDVSTWETDDSESLVRLLVHADLLEIEGLVFTTGWSLGATRDDFLNLIHVAVAAYEQDLPNLCKRSGQIEHLPDESRQRVGYWPSAKSLRDRTVVGSKNRGVQHLGEQNDSAGSKLIIDLVDEDDDRPVWIALWGGGNTLAQAIWRVQRERSPTELKEFLHRLRVYAVTDQDRDQKTPFAESSHQWMRREFEKDLLFIWDECAWKHQNGTGRKNWNEYENHIQNRSRLGRAYPKFKYGVEGDTPSFLHVLPIGLNDPDVPTQGGWGGCFAWSVSEDNVTRCFTNDKGPASTACRDLMERFYPATFKNFAARMEWAEKGTGNRNPIVSIDGDDSLQILVKKVQPGTSVTLDASKSRDPDGDSLTFQYWIASAAGSYVGKVEITDHRDGRATISVPADSAGKTFHVVCEAADAGPHNLVGYRRIVFETAE
ncbi:MAG TPA: nucleoside hydrolase-like domain-containing protein [Pirellulales bacterium]